MKRQHLILAFFFYAAAVFYLAITTPITAHEAKILYTSDDIVGTLVKWGNSLGIGVVGLRIFSLFFGFLSILHNIGAISLAKYLSPTSQFVI